MPLVFQTAPTPRAMAANGMTADYAFDHHHVDDWDGALLFLDPALNLNYKDPELYNHLKLLVDGVTRGPITKETSLVTLYTGGQTSVDGRLLLNLTGIMEPKIPCQLVKPCNEEYTEAKLYPPSGVDPGYSMKLTYNKLASSTLPMPVESTRR